MKYNQDRNWGCRISDEHTFRGMRVLVLENELLRVSVLLDKGADIYEFLYKPLDIDFMWRSPNPLRDPSNFKSSGPREDGFFMDYYHGGWQEIFPTGGAHVTYKGAEIGQHGEVSLIPWQCRIIADDPETVSARMWTRTYRTPFLIERTMTLKKGVAAVFFDERVTNEGAEEMQFMWGHHPAIGEPFLDASCRLDASATSVEVHPECGSDSRLAPGARFNSFPIVKDRDGNDFDLSKIPPPEAKTSEMCYLTGLDEGWFAVTNTSRGAGFGMRWDPKVFPVIWLWEVFGGGSGYPWYGRTYNLALEPWTSWPGGMARSLERGTAPTIQPGESIETSLLATAYSGVTGVSGIDPNGSVRPR